MANSKRSENDQLLEIAIDCAQSAGKLLRDGFGTCFDVENKAGKMNVVTRFDKESEALIVETISARFPDHSILAEEGGEYKRKSEYIWVIDPLDGTLNFSRKIPLFSVSIAVLRDGSPVASAIFLPMLDQLFYARRGGGAYCNRTMIRTSPVETLDQALFATGFPSLDANPKFLNWFSRTITLGRPIRDYGATTITTAYLAMGAFDALMMPTPLPWDIAATTLLIEEAGGKVTDIQGASYDVLSQKAFVATNGHLHDELLTMLAE